MESTIIVAFSFASGNPPKYICLFLNLPFTLNSSDLASLEIAFCLRSSVAFYESGFPCTSFSSSPASSSSSSISSEENSSSRSSSLPSSAISFFNSF